MNNGKEYELRVSGEGLSFERTVSEDTIRRVMGLVLGGDIASPRTQGAAGSAQHSDEASDMEMVTPKVFLTGKRPMNETERVVCLAYYLMHHRDTPKFKTRDLTDLNRKAAQPRLSNPSVTARNATNQRYLTLAGGGHKQITAKGEDLVRALPDREKVREALENHPLTPKHKRKKKTLK